MGVICALLLALAWPGSATAARDETLHIDAPDRPDSAKECAICHYRWIDTFAAGRGTLLAPYGTEKVVAKPEICFSCHDGSVVDSRARLSGLRGHQVGQHPPETMEIPEIFPLDAEGQIQCSTCHTAHGVPSDESADQETIFLRTSNLDSRMCRMCHTDMDGGLETGNHPLGPVGREVRSSTGHSTHDEAYIACETCHTAHGSANERFLVHSALDCSLCFDCHADKNPRVEGSKGWAGHRVNMPVENVKIPQDLVAKGSKLGRGNTVICQTCHKMHTNNAGQKALLLANPSESNICMVCHEGQQTVIGTKHDLTETAPEERNKEGDTALTGGPCSPCHLAHGPSRQFSGEGDLTSQRCLSCHGTGEVAENELLEGYTHPVGMEQDGELVTCVSCHNPHIADPDQEKTSFLASQPPELCSRCHEDKYEVLDTDHDLERTAPESRNVLGKTPSQSGTCAACHLVHSETHIGWAAPMSEEGEDSVERLCLGCHRSGGSAEEKPVEEHTHPVNVAPADFGMHTSLPLLGDSENGTITCTTCHDPHQWSVLDDAWASDADAEGDSTSSFLRLANAPVSLLCEECHGPEALVEMTDHDLVFFAPESTNALDQTPLESGTCGVCHLMHNGEYPAKLWARTATDKIKDRIAAMCADCHSAQGTASNKVPEVWAHPLDVLMLNMGRDDINNPDYFPLRDAGTGQEAHRGVPTCVSCHNVHQWDPTSAERGDATPIEGNATNSFLRMRSGHTPCKECHGPDSLYLYKYFHEADARTNPNAGSLE